MWTLVLPISSGSNLRTRRPVKKDRRKQCPLTPETGDPREEEESTRRQGRLLTSRLGSECDPGVDTQALGPDQ